MTREEFLKRAALMGLGAGLLPSALFTSCSKTDDGFGDLSVNFNGRVLVIGGGAGGLMAGHVLNIHDIDFQILEAASDFGGRVQKLEGFADFPIDLGAEWIHTTPDVFDRMIQDDTQGSIELIPYNPQELKSWVDGSLNSVNVANHFYAERKFKNSTWYDFFGDFIVPPFADRIRYNSPVTAINYSGDVIRVTTSDGTEYEAEKVILNVPLTILQDGDITFTPALPSAKTDALSKVTMPDGLKVFFEFSEKFFPDILSIGSYLSSTDELYIDGGFKKDSNRHFMTLFTVSTFATEYVKLGSDEAIFQKCMNLLDEIFDGKASQTYIKHHVQNWSASPYIRGSYSYDWEDEENTRNALRAPVDNKLFFAGEAYHQEEGSTVHGAGLSGVETARTVLEG